MRVCFVTLPGRPFSYGVQALEWCLPLPGSSFAARGIFGSPDDQSIII